MLKNKNIFSFILKYFPETLRRYIRGSCRFRGTGSRACLKRYNYDVHESRNHVNFSYIISFLLGINFLYIPCSIIQILYDPNPS